MPVSRLWKILEGEISRLSAIDENTDSKFEGSAYDVAIRIHELVKASRRRKMNSMIYFKKGSLEADNNETEASRQQVAPRIYIVAQGMYTA